MVHRALRGAEQHGHGSRPFAYFYRVPWRRDDGRGGRTSGKIVATNPIGAGVDAAEFDPKTGLVYFSTGANGVLSIFHQKSPDEDELVESVPTQPGARTMAVDRKTGKVYVAAAELGPRPAPTPENPRPRPPIIPGTFAVLVIGQQ